MSGPRPAPLLVRGAASVLALLLLLCPLLAAAETATAARERLAAAQAAYTQARYEDAVALLRALLYPTNRLATAADYLNAHKMLGVSCAFVGDRARAEQSFLAILVEQPGFQLDPLVDPPVAVDLFEEVKRRNALLLREVAERKRQQERNRPAVDGLADSEATRASQCAKTCARRAPRPLWVNFVPFGAGQFQQGRRAKGLVLLATQVALGGASLGAALTLRLRYPDSRPPATELESARMLNVAQVATGGLFWAAVVAGIVDALVYHRRAATNDAAPGAALRTAHQAPARAQPWPALTGAPGGLGLRWSY